MRFSSDWKDYILLDASCGERLEQWGDRLFVRPDPQVIWQSKRNASLWAQADAVYHRSSAGGGQWEYKTPVGTPMTVRYGALRFKVEPTGFKHMGLFPEQAVNWDLFAKYIRAAGRPVRVLNLFAYTGGATLACLSAGAQVCHVDASKGMVSWARENAALSGLDQCPVRWIVDDCEKFVARELRRGRTYDCVIMDPPSYGRGPGGEVWKLEERIDPLLRLCAQVLSDRPLFFALNSYTTGLSPAATAYLLSDALSGRFASVSADEIGLPVRESGLVLPAGATAIAANE